MLFAAGKEAPSDESELSSGLYQMLDPSERRRELASVENVDLPRWSWLGDRLVVYRRNDLRRPLRKRCYECKRFMKTGSIGRCDRCFERTPPAVALKVGQDRIEDPPEFPESAPAALRTALEESPSRIR